MSSSPSRRREPFGTSRGVKLPSRSRSVASLKSHTLLETVLEVERLRELGNSDASAAFFS